MAADTSKVVLKLAHPLNAEQAQRAGVEPKNYGVHDEIIVPAGYAMTVINAGMAQVDPQDTNAVRAALTNHPDMPGSGGNGGNGGNGGTGSSAGTTPPAGTTPATPRTPAPSS